MQKQGGTHECERELLQRNVGRPEASVDVCVPRACSGALNARSKAGFCRAPSGQPLSWDSTFNNNGCSF